MAYDDDNAMLGYGVLAVALTLWVIGTVAAWLDPATVAWILCSLFCS